jgi:hypothetical protein
MTTSPLGKDDDAEQRSDGRLVGGDRIEVAHSGEAYGRTGRGNALRSGPHYGKGCRWGVPLAEHRKCQNVLRTFLLAVR